MKYIGYILLFASLIFLFGTVGSVDNNTVPLVEGAIRCFASLALMVVSVLIISNNEENEND